MFILKCPSCSQQVNIAPEFAGSAVKCPICGTQMNVPGTASVEGSAVPPPVPPVASTVESTSSFAASNTGVDSSNASTHAGAAQRSSSMNFSPQWNDVKSAGASATSTWSSTMSPPAHGNTPAASRLVYIILAIFFGTLGVHNFVIGLTGRGATQLTITLLGFVFSFCTFGAAAILILAVFVWSIIDIVTITTDAKGVPLN